MWQQRLVQIAGVPFMLIGGAYWLPVIGVGLILIKGAARASNAWHVFALALMALAGIFFIFLAVARFAVALGVIRLKPWGMLAAMPFSLLDMAMGAKFSVLSDYGKGIFFVTLVVCGVLIGFGTWLLRRQFQATAKVAYDGCRAPAASSANT